MTPDLYCNYAVDTLSNLEVGHSLRSITLHGHPQAWDWSFNALFNRHSLPLANCTASFNLVNRQLMVVSLSIVYLCSPFFSGWKLTPFSVRFLTMETCVEGAYEWRRRGVGTTSFSAADTRGKADGEVGMLYPEISFRFGLSSFVLFLFLLSSFSFLFSSCYYHYHYYYHSFLFFFLFLFISFSFTITIITIILFFPRLFLHLTPFFTLSISFLPFAFFIFFIFLNI